MSSAAPAAATMPVFRGVFRFLTSAVLLPGLLAGVAAGQDLTRRPPPQEGPIAIVNAQVHPVSGPVIPSGFVLFDRGVITEVGSMTGGRVFMATVRQIDATGKHVYPGLISPMTRLGLTEIAATRPSQDSNEVGDFTPEAVAASAINPDSTLLPVTRAGGVLLAGVFPAGGLFPGRAGVIRLEGWTTEDMTVQRDAGLVINWPVMRTITAWWMDRGEDDQRKDIQRNVERIREVFRSARAYLAQRDALKAGAGAGAGGGAGGAPPVDLRYEAFRGVLAADKPRPVFIAASEYDQINAAVAFAIQEGLRPVIVGGRDAPMCAALLKKHDVPVIIDSALLMPKRDDSPVDESFTLPARLEAEGVRWCLTSGQEPSNERNLPLGAAIATAYGLDPAAALRGITLSAAQILGLADRLGSLEPGKEATLFITSGDVLEVTTRVETLFIQGKQLSTDNKQSELAEKYREKYRQQQQQRK